MGLVALTSCNDFNRMVKSTDNEMKYEVAVDYFITSASPTFRQYW